VAQRLRIGFLLRAVLASAAAALTCCGGSGNVSPTFDVSAGYARVTAARARFASARERLDRIQADLSARPQGSQTIGPELREARAAFDAAYSDNQRTLAGFLSTALNEAPDRPETRQALDAFAADAVANARLALERGADLGPTTEALARAERAYGVLGLPVAADLVAALREVRRTASMRPTAGLTPIPSRPASGAKRRRRLQ
jgi:hypothetical protein